MRDEVLKMDFAGCKAKAPSVRRKHGMMQSTYGATLLQVFVAREQRQDLCILLSLLSLSELTALGDGERSIRQPTPGPECIPTLSVARNTHTGHLPNLKIQYSTHFIYSFIFMVPVCQLDTKPSRAHL